MWFLPSCFYEDVRLGPELIAVHERGAGSGLGGKIGILPALLSVDWGYEIDKGAKEGRDWGQSLRCVRHQRTFYGSS